jgi:hypothetical protein
MGFNINQPFQNPVQGQLTPQMPFQPTAINPQGFTNQENINGVFGQANPGTFTRNVQGPLMQTMDPSLAMQVDPTNPGMPAAIQNDMAAAGGVDYSIPQQPPLGVQTPIAPIYDLNNQ